MSLSPVNCYNQHTIYRKLLPLSLDKQGYKEISATYRRFKSKDNIYLMRILNSGNLDNKGVELNGVIKLKKIEDNIRFVGENNEIYFLSEFAMVIYYTLYNYLQVEVCDLDLPYLFHNQEEQTIKGNIAEKIMSIYDIGVNIRNKHNINNVQTTTWSYSQNKNSVYVYDNDKNPRMIDPDEWEVADKQSLLFLSEIQKIKYLGIIHDNAMITDTSFIEEVKKVAIM